MKRRTRFGGSPQHHAEGAITGKSTIIAGARRLIRAAMRGDCTTAMLNDFAILHVSAGHYYEDVYGKYGTSRTREGRRAAQRKVERERIAVMRLLRATRKHVAAACVRK